MTDQAQKDRFVAALTALGGSAGNGKLRDALGWDEATYDTVKQALIDDRAIVPGRGRGGSISIAGRRGRGSGGGSGRDGRPAGQGRQAQHHRGERRLRGRALADGGRSARQHGRRRVQARRPRPDLPQIHLRRLRGNARQARSRTGPRRRPGGPRRVPCSEHLLGAARGALGASQGAGPPEHHRPARGRRHGRHRTRQPRAQGRAAQGLRPARARQDAPRPAHRPDLEHQGRRRRGAREGRARPRLRILPLPVRERRGQEGRRVLHPPLRRQAAGRDAGALPGPGLRPLLRLLGHVRAVDGVHPRPRQRQRQWREGPRPISRSTGRN